jgi:CBS domain-containing protein
VSVAPDSTLAEVFTLLETCAVHRVWIVDADQRPLGVVAISDAIDALLNRL